MTGITLTISISGEQEIHTFNRRSSMMSFVESVSFDLECDGLTVTDTTWVACEGEDCYEVELTVESDEDEECA